MENVIKQMIDALAATTKTNEKKEIIHQFYMDNGELISNYLQLALNPNILFGKSRLERTNVIGNLQYPESLNDILYALLNAKDKDEFKDCLTIAGSTSGTVFDVLDLMVRKDLNCGVGAALVNSALGMKLIPDYKIGKAEEVSAIEDMIFPAYGNLKIDGGRVTATVFPDGSVIFQTSSGNIIKQTSIDMQNDMKNFYRDMQPRIGNNGLQIDGEFRYKFNDGTWLERSKSNGILNKMSNGNASDEDLEHMTFCIFDLLPRYDCIENGGTDMPLCDRVDHMDFLSENTEHSKLTEFVEYVILEDKADMKKYLKHYLDLGEEGIMVKSMKSPYETKRQKHWVKLKRVVDVDVVVVGHTEHKKRSDMIGALMIQSSDGKITGNIGTGEWLTHEKRIELKQRADEGTLIGMILDCEIHEITSNKDGTMKFYLPRITQERFDKTEADSCEKILSMFPSK